MGSELTHLNPHRLVITDHAGQALAAATAQLEEVTDAQMSPLQGRRDEVTVDAWAPHVLIIDPTRAGPGVAHLTDAMSTAAATGTRSTVALLLTTDATGPDEDTAEPRGGADSSDNAESSANAGWRIEVDADGVLHIPEWGIRGTAEALSADAARQLAQFLRSTEDAVSQPAPPSPGDAGWEEHCDTMGSLLPADGVSHDRDQPLLQLAGGEQLSSVLAMPSAAYAAASAVPAESLGVLAPMVAPRARARIEGSDRDLDVELAALVRPLINPVEGDPAGARRGAGHRARCRVTGRGRRSTPRSWRIW